jgi:hypothetical protein
MFSIVLDDEASCCYCCVCHNGGALLIVICNGDNEGGPSILVGTLIDADEF